MNIRCLIVDDDSMTLKIMENLVNQTDGLVCVATCSDAIQASNALKSEEIDLLFLDVEMPQMTGLELVESLHNKPRIVLVTSKEKYAASAFDLDVTDYIVKPVEYPRFLKAVNKVSELMKQEQEITANAEKLFVKVDSQLVGLNLDDILMVEAMADYVRIVVTDKRYTVYSSMKGLIAKLPPAKFMRVHRSFIVNVNRIDRIEDNTLVVGSNLIPVGVTYQKTLMARLNTL